MQRGRRCTFILSPVLSRRDKTLETRHPPTADPVMNVQLRPGRQEGADGRPAVPCRRGRRGGYSVSWSLVPLPRSSQAGVGVAPRCRATPASGCSRGWGPEAGPQGRTVRVGVALTRWRRGGPPAGPYGAETPARATARHGPAWRGVPGSEWPAMSPDGVWLGAATGLPGWGPADRVTHVQDPLLRGPVRAPRSPKAVLLCRPPLPRPRALSWPWPPAAVWARAGLGEDVGRTGPNYRAGWGGSPYHAEDPARSPPVTARAGAGVRTPPRIQLGPRPLPRRLG